MEKTTLRPSENTGFLKLIKKGAQRQAPMLRQGCIVNTHVFKRED